MADEQSNQRQKRLRVIVESQLNAVISSANEQGVTGGEFQQVIPTPMGWVLVYYR